MAYATFPVWRNFSMWCTRQYNDHWPFTFIRGIRIVSRRPRVVTGRLQCAAKRSESAREGALSTPDKREPSTRSDSLTRRRRAGRAGVADTLTELRALLRHFTRRSRGRNHRFERQRVSPSPPDAAIPRARKAMAHSALRWPIAVTNQAQLSVFGLR